jgi:hypothetical protein
MFLGARVDDALSTDYLRMLEQGDTLTPDLLQDAYREHWTRELAAEAARRGIRLGWLRWNRAARTSQRCCSAMCRHDEHSHQRHGR